MELGEGNEEHKGWIFMPRWNFAGVLFLFFSYSCSILTDDEDFDSNWGIPDEPSDEMEMSRSSVTVRSLGDRYVSEQFCHQWSLVFSNLKAISDTNHLFVFIIERACGLPSVVQNSLYPLEMRKNAPLVCTAALYRDGLGAFYGLSSWDCAGRHSSCSGSDMYWCANLEESDYLKPLWGPCIPLCYWLLPNEKVVKECCCWVKCVAYEWVLVFLLCPLKGKRFFVLTSWTSLCECSLLLSPDFFWTVSLLVA